MAYVLRTMTEKRGGGGLWARPSHSADSCYADTGVYYNMGSFGGAAWPTANLLIYVPVRLKVSALVRKLWYSSDSGAGTGNLQIGIYNRVGTRLATSGTVAKTAVTTAVWVDITDTALKPDLYYIGIQASNNTDFYNRVTSGLTFLAALGVRSSAMTTGGFGLPADATTPDAWTVNNSLAYLPHVGMELGAVY
jgi:hypothetical protein